jgi:hypothetical protein
VIIFKLGAAAIALGVGILTSAVTPAPAQAATPTVTFYYYALTDIENCYISQNYTLPSGSSLNNVASDCSTRVWLHQYTNWTNHGWAYCIDPYGVVSVPAQYSHPQNAYVSGNSANC